MKAFSVPNRREFFRVMVEDQPCRLQLLTVNGQPVKVDKEMLGEILNVSAGGMLIQSSLDLPVEWNIIAKVFFKLVGKSFCVEAKLVRKEPDSGKPKYGIKFINLLENDRERLLFVLGRLQVSKVKMPKLNNGRKKD